MSNMSETAQEQYTPRIPEGISLLDSAWDVILLVLLGHAVKRPCSAPVATLRSAMRAMWECVSFSSSPGFDADLLLMKERRKTNTISLGGFYLRRVLRIFPAAYALIAVIAVLGALGVIVLRPGEVLNAATFTMNYHDFRAFWLGRIQSLSVEEQFYLVRACCLQVRGGVSISVGRGVSFSAVALLHVAFRACRWFGR